MKKHSSLIFIRVLLAMLLIPFLIAEPLLAKAVIYTLPLLGLLAFIFEIKHHHSAEHKYNTYILITSLYLIGMMSESDLTRSAMIAGLVFSLYYTLFNPN
ncbi:hypothetical protein E2R51_06845 [Jeotgalibacillus sp. S-D1]|uniref:hypothetical protein n=1 Tax=Jeotgalibacillus sp. S-D1 TaxID=2552189 RepID=UPI00105AA2BA|nr:hypothetical protein [Jeotgalibacillus sp. S-D1]TDL35422.1 hypothetical protein E2R51_06845 [Jeotgalibacillus sp. S-D1]